MEYYLAHSLVFCEFQKFMQVLLMAMHADRAYQSHHMEHRIMVFNMFEKFVEGGNFFIIATRNGSADADQIRLYGPPRAYGHMTYLAIANDTGQKPHVLPASFKKRMRKIIPQIVEKRRVGGSNGIVLLFLPITPAVQNYQGNS